MTRSRRRFFRHGFFPQLMAFEACLRHGSVTRAAEELSLAQPTVSCLLRKLSDTVGEPLLLHRHGRMVATPAGMHMAALCEDIVAALDRYDVSSRDGTPDEEGADPRGSESGDGGVRSHGEPERMEGRDRDRR